MFKQVLFYTTLLFKATPGKKNFTELSKVGEVSHDRVSRELAKTENIIESLELLAIEAFKDKKVLYLEIDTSIIRKMFSEFIEGTDGVFDTKIGKMLTGFNLFAAGLSDGKNMLPFFGEFAEKKDSANQKMTVVSLLKKAILRAKELFPNTRIIVVADGAFATVENLKWCVQNNVYYEGRIAKNRAVYYQGERKIVKEIEDLVPKGNQMARTIQVSWYNLLLYITAERRRDKNNVETIVYQVSTFKAKPMEHVLIYKKRWKIEEFFRTIKQKLGLQDCASTKKDTQLKHVHSVFLAYSLAVLEKKSKNFSTVEDAIRALDRKKPDFLIHYFSAPGRIFHSVHA